jgi:hypothetical protein
LKKFDPYEEIQIIEKMIAFVRTKLPQNHMDSIDHYKGVGEREMAFEYIMLEAMERGIVMNIDKNIILELAYSMDMKENCVNDDFFMEKLEKYISDL